MSLSGNTNKGIIQLCNVEKGMTECHGVHEFKGVLCGKVNSVVTIMAQLGQSTEEQLADEEVGHMRLDREICGGRI